MDNENIKQKIDVNNEVDIKQMKHDINIEKRKGISIEFERTLILLKEDLRPFIESELKKENNLTNRNGSVLKDKEYLREKIQTYTINIKREIIKKDLKVRKNNNEYYEANELSLLIAHEFVGYSVLKIAMEDDKVSDVFCLKWNKIYVERNGEKIRYPFSFRSAKHYSDFLERILRADRKEINNSDRKIVDFDLFGDRYAVKSKAVSHRGETLTIRKHKEDQVTLNQIIEGKTMDQKLADFLGLTFQGGCNVIIAGITGSGKTTTLRALLNYYVKDKRIGVAEDTVELHLKNEHTIEYVSSTEMTDKYPVTLADLIRTFLREKPDMIVIGEVRGVEMDPAVEAMATGHSTLFTMHSGTPFDTINRGVLKYLESKPTIGTEIAERIIGNALDYIVIQDDIPGIGRRITSVTQVSYSYKEKCCILEPIWEYNFETDKFDLVGGFDEHRIKKMRRRGLKLEQLKPYIKEGA